MWCCVRLMLCLTLSVSAAPKETKDKADVFPVRKFPELPGKIVGVLVSNGLPLQMEQRAPQAGTLMMGHAGSSYREVYVARANPTDGRAMTVQLPNGKTQSFPGVGTLDQDRLKEWGATGEDILVQVEVNGGAGSAEGERSFVATHIKVLVGKDNLPLKISESRADCLKKHERLTKENADSIDKEMKASATKILGKLAPTGPKESITIPFLSWHPKTERLEIRFRTRISDGIYAYGSGIPRDLKPGEGSIFGEQFGVVFGTVFEVDENGRIVSEKWLPPEGFTLTIHPPGSSSGRKSIDAPPKK